MLRLAALTALVAGLSTAPDVAPDALQQKLLAAAAADWALRSTFTCDPARLAELRAAVDALAALPSPDTADTTTPGTAQKPVRWAFPVSRVRPEVSIGGSHGEGYVRNRGLDCYTSKRAGHPAQDLFVWDDDSNWVDDKDGTYWTAHAVENARVLVARTGWQPGDPSRGGNYVMLYLPARGVVAYYAHLHEVRVKAGEFVPRGGLIGIIGRTGLNAWKRRSPTHLHFALWDIEKWLPVNPYKELVGAEQTPALDPPLAPDAMATPTTAIENEGNPAGIVTPEPTTPIAPTPSTTPTTTPRTSAGIGP